MSKNQIQFDVIVFGSCIVDYISYVQRMPKNGETIQSKKIQTGFGGKGANQIIAASKLNSKTAIIGKLGSDTWGINYRENFIKNNVNIDFLELVEKQSTGIAQILVSDDGENQIVIFTGANNSLSQDDVIKAESILNNAKVLVCQLETPIPATIKALEEFNGVSILNAAPGLSSLPKELFNLPNIFCVNELEATEITSIPIESPRDAKTAAEKLLQLGCNIVIITLGAAGVCFSSKEDPRVVYVKAPKVDKVVDTTGSGDAFVGALAHFIAMHNNRSMLEKIGTACEIASHSVQFPGTQSSYSSFSEIDQGSKTFDFEVL